MGSRLKKFLYKVASINCGPILLLDKVIVLTKGLQKSFKHMTPMCMPLKRSCIIAKCPWGIRNKNNEVDMIPGQGNMANCTRVIFHSIMESVMLQVSISFILSCAGHYRSVRYEQMGFMPAQLCSRKLQSKTQQLWRLQMLVYALFLHSWLSKWRRSVHM